MTNFFKLYSDSPQKLRCFFLLASALFSADAFLYLYNGQKLTLASFQWSSLRGNQIGEVLIFLLAFSFVTTIATPICAQFLRWTILFVDFIPKPARFEAIFYREEQKWDRLSAGYVTVRELEN